MFQIVDCTCATTSGSTRPASDSVDTVSFLCTQSSRQEFSSINLIRVVYRFRVHSFMILVYTATYLSILLRTIIW